MGRLLYMLLAAAVSLGVGCTSGPPLAVPGLPPGESIVEAEPNPFFIPLGPQPEAYAKVFENMLQVLGDYGFELLETNRYSGQIETRPRVAPGLVLFMKPGSPDLRERTLATLQTYRHRISIQIQPAENGGYFVEVVARKELQDLPRPVKQTVGAAIFQYPVSVERQFEVIDPTVYETGWIFKGRDPALEQKIIEGMKKLM